MRLVERRVVDLLARNGPITGTAAVGYGLWPDRDIQPQGAACAAGRIVSGLVGKGYVQYTMDDKRKCYAVTDAGRAALEEAIKSDINPRQLLLFRDY